MPDVLVRSPRLLPAPDPNPPYDAPEVSGVVPRQMQAPGQGVLALEFLLPSGVPAAPRPTPWIEVDSDRLDVQRWSRMLARAIAETLGGARPPAQLRFWVTTSVHHRVLHAMRLTDGARYTVAAVHTRVASPRAVEATATLHGVDHAHAMAFRLEARHDAWLCTALEIGMVPRRR